MYKDQPVSFSYEKTKGLRTLFYLLSLLPTYRNDLGWSHSFNTCQYVFRGPMKHQPINTEMSKWHYYLCILLDCPVWRKAGCKVLCL